MTITLVLSPDVQRKLEALAVQNEQSIEIVANRLFRQAVETVNHDDINDQAAGPSGLSCHDPDRFPVTGPS